MTLRAYKNSKLIFVLVFVIEVTESMSRYNHNQVSQVWNNTGERCLGICCRIFNRSLSNSSLQLTDIWTIMSTLTTELRQIYDSTITLGVGVELKLVDWPYTIQQVACIYHMTCCTQDSCNIFFTNITLSNWAKIKCE